MGLAADRMRGEKEEGKDEKDPSQNLKLRGFLQITHNVICFISIMQTLRSTRLLFHFLRQMSCVGEIYMVIEFCFVLVGFLLCFP